MKEYRSFSQFVSITVWLLARLRYCVRPTLYGWSALCACPPTLRRSFSFVGLFVGLSLCSDEKETQKIKTSDELTVAGAYAVYLLYESLNATKM